MLSVLRSLLAEIAPGWLKRERLESVSNDNGVQRDTLSAKRNPVPFGKKGAKPVPKPAEPEWPRAKRTRKRGAGR